MAPVEEMVGVFMQAGRSWLHRKVEVIGAIGAQGRALLGLGHGPGREGQGGYVYLRAKSVARLAGEVEG